MSLIPVTISFRLDDPCATSDHAVESDIFEIFSRRRVPLCIAAVPFGMSRDSGKLIAATRNNLPHLVQAVGSPLFTVTQHGFSHSNRSTNVQSPTEFCGVDKLQQEEMIRSGKHVLESALAQQVTGFVPPWNSLDEATVEILGRLEFAYFSGGYHFPVRLPKAGLLGRIVSLPRTCTLTSLASAVYIARKLRTYGAYVICVFHPDDFIEHRANIGRADSRLTTLSALDAMIDNLTGMPDVTFRRIDHVAKDVSASNSIHHAKDFALLKFIPNRYRYRVSTTVLLRKASGFAHSVFI